ncbi:MAG: HAD family phosphatase [Patescibacteria group bacterium]
MKNEKIKFVFFDFDGVLISKGHFKESFEKAKIHAGKNFVEKPENFNGQKVLEDALTGKITIEEEHKLYADAHGFDYDFYINEFYKNYKSKNLFPEMVEIVKNLKEKNFGVGILSDTTDFFETYTIPHFNLTKIFDPILNSSRIGMSKHQKDLKIYDFATKKINLSPEEILFIDDREDNVLDAKKFGWNAIQFLGDFERLRNELKEILGDF